MQKNKIVIIGLGSIGRKLVQKLSREFLVVCIDIDKNRTEGIEDSSRKNSVTSITGDATSRLVLERAGVAHADIVIVTIKRESISLEIVRVLQEYFDPGRIIAIGATQSCIRKLEGSGVEVESIDMAGVVGIINKIEQKSQIIHGVGIGMNEIRMVEIHTHSRLAYKPLSLISSLQWRIGIIYRNSKIIVPGGKTILKPRDKVIILGKPSVLGKAAAMLTFSFRDFPLEYGSSLLAYFDSGDQENFVEEIAYIYRTFRLKGLSLVHKKNMSAGEIKLFRTMVEKAEIPICGMTPCSLEMLPHRLMEKRGQFGFIVLAKKMLRFFHLGLFGKGPKNVLLKLSQATQSPILLANGTFPYQQSVITGEGNIDLTHVMENIFEMAAIIPTTITVLLVQPSSYIAGEEEIKAFEEKKKQVTALSNIYKLHTQTSILRGNPIRVVPDCLKDFNLFLIDTSGLRQHGFLSSWLSPDVAWEITRRSEISTLVIPEAEESL